MRADIGLMMGCDAVALVPATQEARDGSKGMQLELAIAAGLGMPIGPVEHYLAAAAQG